MKVWTGDLLADYDRADHHRHPWRQVSRLLQDAEAELDRELADCTDPASCHRAVEQTADLTAVLIRVEHPPAQLHRTHDQLTRAAQFPCGHRRPPPRQAGVVLPALVRAARLAAVSKDPAPLVLAGILVLLYGIIKALSHFAKQHDLRASARQQIAAAADELYVHPIVWAGIESAANGARSGTTRSQLRYASGEVQ